MSPSPFELLPPVLLNKIAVTVTALTFLGPPTDLMSLLLLSKAVHSNISWPWVFAQVFRQKFDISAPVRRLGAECGSTSALASELPERFRTLGRFKNKYFKDGHLDIVNRGAETLRVDLWRAYLMFLEDDGKNAAQLVQYAAVNFFADFYISEHGPLQTGAAANDGGIVDNESNSLATELFWHTEKGRNPYETPSQSQDILTAISLPFSVPSKYPSTLGPIDIATNPPTHSELSSLTWWPVSRPCVIPDYFGCERTLVQPPIAQAAIASSSIRYEKQPYKIYTPDMLRRFQEGGLRVSEIQDYHAQPDRLRLVDLDQDRSAPGSMSSRHFDQDWQRLFNCRNPQPSVPMRPVYTPGSLHGRWIGDLFRGQPQRRGIPLDTVVEFELREYHQHSKDAVFPFSDANAGPKGAEGILSAWFPSNTATAEFLGRLEVSVENTDISSEYRVFDHIVASPLNDPSQDPEAPFGHGVWDIILVGNVVRGPAAGENQYFGRVRSWDGLVVIHYSTGDPMSRRILYGYLRGHGNIVGRWRDYLAPLTQQGWSGAWTMTKCP